MIEERMHPSECSTFNRRFNGSVHPLDRRGCQQVSDGGEPKRRRLDVRHAADANEFLRNAQHFYN
jgi:hypothetical protein